jgi:hypothetical protein
MLHKYFKTTRSLEANCNGLSKKVVADAPIQDDRAMNLDGWNVPEE